MVSLRDTVLIPLLTILLLVHTFLNPWRHAQIIISRKNIPWLLFSVLITMAAIYLLHIIDRWQSESGMPAFRV